MTRTPVITVIRNSTDLNNKFVINHNYPQEEKKCVNVQIKHAKVVVLSQ